MPKDPYAHLPVMKRPGYVNKQTKKIYAKNVRLGDEVRQSADVKGGMWKITEIDIRGGLVYVRYGSRKRMMVLAPLEERIFVDRPMYVITEDGQEQALVDGQPEPSQSYLAPCEICEAPPGQPCKEGCSVVEVQASLDAPK